MCFDIICIMADKTHTVTFIIGNGFDINILSKLQKSYSTTYKEFFNYLTFFLKDKENNSIYLKIIEDKKRDDYIWSDYEELLEELVNEKKEEIKKEFDKRKQGIIYEKFMKDWEEIQYKFADFLNFVIKPETLMRVSNMDGVKAFEKCIGDLCEEEWSCLKFRNLPTHQDSIKYNILNFNYSTLADNYFFHLRDPHPFNGSTNNSYFYPNPKGYQDSPFRENDFLYIKTKVAFYHPHGQLAIPSSILFGMGYNKSQYRTSIASSSSIYNNHEEDIMKKMDKLYWCDSKEQIMEELNKTNLYIIFGHSIGKSDKWWWEKILCELSKGESELILYDYNNSGLKERLLSFKPELEKLVDDKIFVINFDDENPLTTVFDFSESSKI